jgi:hypothetical protein
MSRRKKTKTYHQDKELEDIIDDTNNQQSTQDLCDFFPSPKA